MAPGLISPSRPDFPPTTSIVCASSSTRLTITSLWRATSAADAHGLPPSFASRSTGSRRTSHTLVAKPALSSSPAIGSPSAPSPITPTERVMPQFNHENPRRRRALPVARRYALARADLSDQERAHHRRPGARRHHRRLHAHPRAAPHRSLGPDGDRRE